MGASVQCGSRSAGSNGATTSDASAAISAPVIVTRESAGDTTGTSPVGRSSKSELSDFKKLCLFVGEQRINLRHVILRHLVENFFHALDLIFRKSVLFFHGL